MPPNGHIVMSDTPKGFPVELPQIPLRIEDIRQVEKLFDNRPESKEIGLSYWKNFISNIEQSQEMMCQICKKYLQTANENKSSKKLTDAVNSERSITRNSALQELKNHQVECKKTNATFWAKFVDRIEKDRKQIAETKAVQNSAIRLFEIKEHGIPSMYLNGKVKKALQNRGKGIRVNDYIVALAHDKPFWVAKVTKLLSESITVHWTNGPLGGPYTLQWVEDEKDQKKYVPWVQTIPLSELPTIVHWNKKLLTQKGLIRKPERLLIKLDNRINWVDDSLREFES